MPGTRWPHRPKPGSRAACGPNDSISLGALYARTATLLEFAACRRGLPAGAFRAGEPAYSYMGGAGMRIQRLRFTAWVVGLAMVFGVSSVAGTAAASATGGSSGGAAAAKAKAKAKHKKSHKKKKLTRGEKLAKALKACKKDKSKKKEGLRNGGAEEVQAHGRRRRRPSKSTVTVPVTGPGTTTPTGPTTAPTPATTPAPAPDWHRRRHDAADDRPNLVWGRWKRVRPRRSKRLLKSRSRPRGRRNS